MDLPGCFSFLIAGPAPLNLTFPHDHLSELIRSFMNG